MVLLLIDEFDALPPPVIDRVVSVVGYAKKLGVSAATMAVFASVEDDAILAKLSSESEVDGVRVTIMAFGWV